MRYLFSTVILFVFILAQAYLVKGVRTTILVNGVSESKVKNIFFEGCDKDNCSEPEYKNECKKDNSPLKFHCHMNDQYPFFVRLTVVLKGDSFFSRNKILSTKFISANGTTSLGNFKLNITEDAVMAEPFKGIL